MFKIINISFLIGNVNQLIQILCRLLLIPILITNLGYSLYSDWLYINAIFSILSISNFGITSSSLNTLYANRYNKIIFNNIYIKTLNLNFLISILYILLGIILYFILTINVQFGDLIILILYYSLIHPFNFIINYYQAIEKQHIDAFYNIVIYIAQFILILFTSFIYPCILLLSFSLIFPYLTLCILIFKRKIWPIYFLNLKIPNLNFRNSFYFTLVQANSYITNSIPLILLKMSSSDELVVLFNIYKTVSNLFLRFVSMYPNASWPSLSERFVNNDNKFIYSIYRRSILIYFISIILSTILIYLELNNFILSYLSPINDYFLFDAIFFYIIIFSYQQINSIFLQSFTEIKFLSIYMFICNIICYTFFYYFINNLSIIQFINLLTLFEFIIYLLTIFLLYKLKINLKIFIINIAFIILVIFYVTTKFY